MCHLIYVFKVMPLFWVDVGLYIAPGNNPPPWHASLASPSLPVVVVLRHGGALALAEEGQLAGRQQAGPQGQHLGGERKDERSQGEPLRLCSQQCDKTAIFFSLESLIRHGGVKIVATPLA